MKCSSQHSRLASTPTDALPGTPEKVRVLAERARLGVCLWHPLDAGMSADASRVGLLLVAVEEAEAPVEWCLAS